MEHDSKEGANRGAIASPTVIPHALEERIALNEARLSLAPVLRPERLLEIDLPSIDRVGAACAAVDRSISRELSLRAKADPMRQNLEDIREITRSIAWAARSMYEFRTRMAAYDAGAATDITPLGRGMLELAEKQCRETAAAKAAELNSITIAAPPLTRRLLDAAKVLFTSASLLAIGGSIGEKSVDPFERPPQGAPTSSELQSRDEPDGGNGGAARLGGVSSQGKSAQNGETSLISDQSDSAQVLQLNLSGEIPVGQSHAGGRISFPFFSSISDSLWLGAAYARDGAGAFKLTPRSTELIEDDIEAHVTRGLPALPAGHLIHTPAPFGFAAHSVTLTTVDGTPVPFTFDARHNVLRVDAASPEGVGTVLAYDVGEARESIALPEPLDLPILRPHRHENIIQALRLDPSRTEEALDAVCARFTYLVSSDMAAIIALIPGGLDEEVYSLLEYGDCDTVSIVAAGILNDAGIRAGIIVGDVESGGWFKAGHAKVVYETAAGELKTYETTARMKAYFFGVKLAESDRQVLHTLAAAVPAPGDRAAREAGFEALRRGLDDILARPEYAAYRILPEEAGGSERSWLTNFSDRRRLLDRETQGLVSALLSVAAMGAAAAGAYAAARTGNRRFGSSSIELGRSTIAHPLSGESGPISTADARVEGMHKALSGAVEARLKHLQKASPTLDPALLNHSALTIGEKQKLLKYLTVLESLGPSTEHSAIYSVGQLRYTLRMRNRLGLFGGEPVTVEQVFRAAIEEAIDPRALAKAREAVPKQLEEIMLDAKKRAAASRPPQKRRGVKEPTPHLSTVKSDDSSDDFYGFRELAPGESAEHIDWRASARVDKLIVREFRAPRKVDPVLHRPLHLVLDLNGAYHGDYVRTAELLLSSGESRRIASLVVCGRGEVLQALDERTIKRQLSGPRNSEAISKFIGALLEQQLRVNPESYCSSWNQPRDILARCMSLYFPTHLLAREGEVVVLGNHTVREHISPRDARSKRGSAT